MCDVITVESKYYYIQYILLVSSFNLVYCSNNLDIKKIQNEKMPISLKNKNAKNKKVKDKHYAETQRADPGTKKYRIIQ